MKIVYILLVLALIPSFAKAQNEVVNVNIEKRGISSSVFNSKVVAHASKNELVQKETLLIDVSELKQSIAKNSDIRTYLNIVRNISNIGVIFPKINKPVKA